MIEWLCKAFNFPWFKILFGVRNFPAVMVLTFAMCSPGHDYVLTPGNGGNTYCINLVMDNACSEDKLYYVTPFNVFFLRFSDKYKEMDAYVQ